MRRLILFLSCASILLGQGYVVKRHQISFTGTAATPTFSPTAGAVSNPTTVTISTGTGGCSSYIYYKTSAGVTSSDTNSTSFSVTTAGTWYAKVIGCPGYADSAEASSAYTIASSNPIQFATGKTCSNALAGGSGGISCSASMTLAANTLVVVGCDADNASAATITATDDASNTYTALTGAEYSYVTTLHMKLFAFFYSSGQTRTPKCNYSVNPSSFRDIIAVGYLYAASTSFQDGTGAGTWGDTSPANTGTITTTSCGSAIVEYVASTVAGTIANNGNYTVRLAPSSNGNGMLDHIPTTTLSEAATAATPGQWVAVAAGIKAASPCQ